MVHKISTIVVKHPEQAFVSQTHLDQNWKAFNYEACPNFNKTLAEFTAFEKIVKQEVGDVQYLPANKDVGLDSIYTHDSVKITHQGAIYFPMGKSLRKPETSAMQNYLENKGIPTLGHISGEGKMEGGDIVWLDTRTVAIGLGYRTNQEGIEQFRNLTKEIIDEIIVVPMPHADGADACLHLMSVISMVDMDLAVVYLKYMPVFFKKILEKRGMALLNVSDAEYERLGSNVLALAPRRCVMLEGNPEIQAKLERAGAEVFTYPGQDLSIMGTGGPTCLTQPICRVVE